ncbi:MAG: hypothetical protein KAR21_13925, partial [Spirochaetales bacterium]|nr:hypothetical protein [Spirochaetales bacterium]
LFFIILTFTLSSCYMLSWGLEPDSLFLFSAMEKIFSLFLYIILLFIPFFTAGMIVGTILFIYKEDTGLLYGMNLIGSGVGGGLALMLMFRISPTDMPFAALIPALFGALLWIGSSESGIKRVFLSLMAVLSVFLPALLLVFFGTYPEMDQYKTGAYIRELEKQGLAELVCRRPGPMGMIECYSSSIFHDTFFAGLENPYPPPPQISILIDGNMAGTLFTTYSPEEEGILDYTPQAIPYHLIENPRVLLLGEVGGSNIWLAKRMGSSEITVVQPDRVLVNLIRNELVEYGGKLFSSENIELVFADPRNFIEHTRETFDIIHISRAEGMPAFSGGLFSLHEDFLLTTESISRAISILSDRGVISVSRGTQIPPRDSLRLFSTFYSALEEEEGVIPGENLVQMQNYLASITLAFKSRVSPERLDKLLGVSKKSGSSAVYYPEIETSNPTLLQQGIALIIDRNSKALKESYIFDVSAPTDSRPYFHHFFKLESLKWAGNNFSSIFLFNTEIGYLVLLAVFAVVVILSFVLVLVPLAVLLKAGTGREAFDAVPYFFLIGFGFMFFEMAYIQKISLFIGDPVISISAVIISILLFSGTGSIVQSHLHLGCRGRVKLASASLLVIMLLYVLFLDNFFSAVSFPHMTGRYLLSVLVLMPPSFFMGWFFASGLEILHHSNRKLVPLAWGVNGAASVMAVPLSTILMISFGSGFVAVIALLLYGAVPFALKLFRG